MNFKRKNIKKFLTAVFVLFSFLSVVIMTSCMGMGAFQNNGIQNTTQDQGVQTYTVVKGNIFQESNTSAKINY